MNRFARRASAGGVALLLTLVLAGCVTPSNTPDNYNAQVETNFVQGCQALNPQNSSIGTGASQAYCQCAYNWFTNNVPYSSNTAPAGYTGDTFEGLTSTLGQDPAKMPQAIQDALAASCAGTGSSGSPNDTAVTPSTSLAPSTTVAPTTTIG